MTTVDEFFKDLPPGWRANVGHIPYIDAKRPKNLKAKPFEAYVATDGVWGTEGYAFASVEGESPLEALTAALAEAHAILKSKAEEHAKIKADKKEKKK